MNDALLLPLRGPVRRILVLRPRALGDVLLATPALRALRHGFPQAELHAAIDDTLEPLLRRNPHLHRLWLFPRRAPSRGAWLQLYRALRAARFDLVIDLHGSPRTAWMAWWTRAPNRVGYALRGRGRLYNLGLPRDCDRRGRRRLLYAAQTNLEIVARCGVQGEVLEDTGLVYVPDPASETHAETLLAQIAPGRPRVGVSPAGTWQAKTWPVESFAQAADAMARAGCIILVLWGPGERVLAERMRAAMREPSLLAPATDIDALASVLGRLDLLVCNDSGLKHLAVARGTRTLTLFGPTHPRNWNPESARHVVARAALPCLACNLTRCSHHLCMRLLEPREVALRALQMTGLQHLPASVACDS